MKQKPDTGKYPNAVIKDLSIVALIFAALYFIDIRLASFVSGVAVALLLTRRIILDYNPGFVQGHHILYYGKELSVPKGVDIYNLRNRSMESLQKYIEVIGTILIPPNVLVIRFVGIFEMDEYDLYLLKGIIERLKKFSIILICSDVEKNIELQFKNHGIEKHIPAENICYDINDAISRAEKLLLNFKKDKTQ